MLMSSFTFGIRQSLCPPSPIPPSVLTSSSQSQIVVAAESQGKIRVTSWRPLAATGSRIFCSHMSPVFRSVMVPSPLFWYASAPPACTTPSSRTGASVIFSIGGCEVVCPVAGNVLLPHLPQASAEADRTPRPNNSARLLARTKPPTRYLFRYGPVASVASRWTPQNGHNEQAATHKRYFM